MCLSSLLFFASFNMIIPELPAYLTSLGGGEYKGLIISLFTLTAMISRPFSGKLADRIGRVPVMVFGPIVCVICSAIYPIVTTVAGFLVLRLIHGFSTGFKPTGQTAYLSDIIPAERRGEAMGLLGTTGSVGMAAGPALGGPIASYFGLNVMFYASSLCGLISIVILLGIKETLKNKHPYSIDLIKIDTMDLFEPKVIMACVVMVLSAYAYGAMYTIMPDFGEFVGIKNKGLLFTYLTISSLAVRLLGGKASDRWGRQPVLLYTTGVIAIGMIVIGLATTRSQLLFGVVLYGLAQGMASPTLLAWATDLSDEHHKGRGVASVYMAMEFGIGMGAFGSGLIFANETSNFFITFLTAALLSAGAFVYLIFLKRRTRSVS
ncbi:MAG TPA: MFS transporter [Cyclobacteriaceae bacterium]|nr:MFS transporter [Cyclobacteriaceae bacterium]